jgi:hypothetical protein
VRTLAEQVALETRTRMLNPEVVRGHAGARLRGRAPDRGACAPTPWAGRRRPARSQPWVYQQLTRDLRARPADARAARRAQPDGVGQGRQPPARGARAPLLEARRRRRSRRCAARARNSKTGSKALPNASQPHEGSSMRPSSSRRTRAAPDGEGSVQVHLDPAREDRHRQGVRRLRQGRHRQEHDLLEPVGGLLARSASACCRSAATPSTTRPSR